MDSYIDDSVAATTEMNFSLQTGPSYDMQYLGRWRSGCKGRTRSSSPSVSYRSGSRSGSVAAKGKEERTRRNLEGLFPSSKRDSLVEKYLDKEKTGYALQNYTNRPFEPQIHWKPNLKVPSSSTTRPMPVADTNKAARERDIQRRYERDMIRKHDASQPTRIGRRLPWE
eukprot:TRINITY_DN9903_c1_g4_i1.p1 TRINITY_DN9903_c1_g4~~TRINITY_DN9903_c1_g4_i1.p1  ORF type:complete len:169 (+),score=32.01 TRINITY_DN9903_c1_g4_i1:64-570(+)